MTKLHGKPRQKYNTNNNIFRVCCVGRIGWNMFSLWVKEDPTKG